MSVRPPGAAEGSRRALVERMFRVHRGALERYALRRVGRDGASDVVADVFCVVLASDRPVPPESEQLAWLYGFARLKVLELHRGTLRRERLTTRLAGHRRTWRSADPAEMVTANQWVSTFLATLRDDDAELLRLVVWEDLSIVEAAGVLDVSPGSARARLHRIRKRTEARLVRRRSREGGLRDG